MTRARQNANISPAVGRNMVINGSMNVAQRGTSLTMAHDGVQSGYLLDRFAFAMGSNQDTFDGAYSQASDGPDGVSANSILWTTGTAEAAIAATEIMYLVQTIEAQNCHRLGLGTSVSQQITLTFYVKSSITGTYGVNVYKPDAAGDLTASIVTGTYTISSANTWERKTITFPSGTAAALGITYDNGVGLHITWHLAAGSNYTATDGTSWGDYAAGKWAYGHAQNGVVTTASATWGITGVQLEVGKVATPFEHRSYGEELAACQRYFERIEDNKDMICVCTSFTTQAAYGSIDYKVEKRTSPEITFTGGASNYRYRNAGNNTTLVGIGATSINSQNFRIDVDCGAGNITAGQSGWLSENTGATGISIDAEL